VDKIKVLHTKQMKSGTLSPQIKGEVYMRARVLPVILIVIATLLLLSICGESLVNNSAFYPLPGSRLDITALPDSIEDYYLESSDGVKLSAFYIPNPDANKTVMYFHGNAGNASQRLPIATALAKLRSNVLLVEYRGYGLSEGKPSEAGIYIDARAALAFLVKQRGITPDNIILLGRSLGSAPAIDLALDHDFAGLILVTPLSSGKDVAKNSGMGYLIPFIGDPFNNKDKIAELTIPILIIHGDSDEVLPLEMSLTLEKLAQSPTKMVIIPSAGHNNIVNDYEEIFYGHVKSFYDDVLGNSSETPEK
jgi:hypothetical protein